MPLPKGPHHPASHSSADSELSVHVILPHGYLVEVPKRDIASQHPLAVPPSVRTKCDLSGGLLVDVVDLESNILALIDFHVLREVVKSLKGNLLGAQ